MPQLYLLPISSRRSGMTQQFGPWRGFNLLEKFTLQMNSPFVELDFQRMSEWGFDFVRLPMDYRCWALDGDFYKIDEKSLRQIDRAVEFGRKYGIHVDICFHRAPGYCINPPKEPLNLWKDEEALEACEYHWSLFAKRYKGIPSRRVSFAETSSIAHFPAISTGPCRASISSGSNPLPINRNHPPFPPKS